MEQAERIDLAHAPSFTLGRLVVHPAVHQVRRDDGAEEVLQHRVMQVLVALARVDGAIVTRDELTMSCWDGRVVGEDAINRILSRLRAVAGGIGAGSFRIETVTRVGYRLLRDGQAAPETALVADADKRPSRRSVLIGGGAMAAVAAAGGLFYALRPAPGGAPVPPEIAAMIRQAETALGQGNPEGTGQAIGLLRQVVERAPDLTQGWGLLASAYAWSYWGSGARTDASMADRARAAIERARAIDPDNPDAIQAELLLMPLQGTWAERERRSREAIVRHPGHIGLLMSLGWTLSQVGRWREAIDPLSRAVAAEPSFPALRYPRDIALWSANRLEETDTAFRQDLDLFPTNFAVWFGRFDFLLVGGRINEAIALGEDVAGRPPGIAPREFEEILQSARALQSGDQAMIDASMRRCMEKARQGTGYAEIAIKYGSLFHRFDDAFAAANALFFGEGFDPGDLRYSPEQGIRSPHRDRRTHFLFLPSCAALRTDPRFDALVERIGLTRYWAETRTRPDYRQS